MDVSSSVSYGISFTLESEIDADRASRSGRLYIVIPAVS